MSQDDFPPNIAATSTPALVEEDELTLSDSVSEEDELLDGVILPLNSKKIIISKLRRLATMLEISAEGSAATLRQIIEGKLIKLGHKPHNTQVIVGKVDSRLYLLDDSEIIVKEVEHVSNEAVVETHLQQMSYRMKCCCIKNYSRCISNLRNELSSRDAMLDTLRSELVTATQKLATVKELQVEVQTLKKSLRMQTAKAKRFWKQKCEQLLAHEALIKEKDAEIASLKELASGSRATSFVPDSQSEGNETNLLSETSTVNHGRRGKAPPVDTYNGNDP